MKAVKTEVKEVKETKEFPGLVKAEFAWKISDATIDLHYMGPVIDPGLWHEIMSFFHWTYDTHHSEAQVRLYVNPVEERWGALSFQQEGGTGVTSKELAIKEKPEEAAVRFAYWDSDPSDDWIYFGTVHHHCSMSAFQSGTDQENESHQDGLHITVGTMDKGYRDMHARFYLNRTEFLPDMSLFWDVGADVRHLVPVQLMDQVARHQMNQKVIREFPKEWKANYIEKKVWTPAQATGHYGSYAYDGGLGYRSHDSDFFPGKFSGNEDPAWLRAEKAMTRINQSLRQRGIELTLEELEKIFERWNEPSIAAIQRIMAVLRVDADDMLKHGIPSLIKKLDAKNQKQLPQGTPPEYREGYGPWGE